MEKSTGNTAKDAAEREIARRLEAEKERWQARKIEALGKLAGGMAHDFNNFLAVIMLHVDMLNLQLEADSPHRRRVSEIKEVSNNAAATVRQLMAFGRKLPMNLSPTALNQVIENFSKIPRANLAENIEIEINLEPDLGVCFVDPNQITQVLQNLAAHASDAMPNGGMLKIETANILLSRNDAHEAQFGGSYVQIIVSDNSVGLETETLEHIFEPFFSTGEARKGAGLRLASVYGIVKQLNGFIWATSKANRGTTFKIQFPRIDPAAETVAAKLESSERTAARGETVLLVEDDRAVRLITGEILKFSGYRVFEARNGMEALEFAQSYNEPIHLLLTDVSMPLMNGREVAEKVANLHPEIVVLFMSGDIGDAIAAQKDTKENNYIGKPFSPALLTAKVGEILNRITS